MGKAKKLTEIVDLMYHLNGRDIVYVNNNSELDYRIKTITRKSIVSTFKNIDHCIETYRFHIEFHNAIDFETFKNTVEEYYSVGFYKKYKNENIMNTFLCNSDFLEPILSVEGKVISFKDEMKYPAIGQINKYLEIRDEELQRKNRELQEQVYREKRKAKRLKREN